MQVQLVGLDDREARCEREIVNEMERLVARIEAKDEVCEARDRGPFSLHLCSGTTSVGHRVRAGDFSQESREADRGVVLVVPVVPAPGGNGLAMRAGMLLEAVAARCGVDLVIVPVSGPAEDIAWAAGLARSVTVLAPARRRAARAALTRNWPTRPVARPPRP